MSKATHSGPIPKKLDKRIKRRDKEPLPAGAIVKFQVINRGKSPTYNYRWLLLEDGAWYLAKHSGADSDWRVPFDTELPERPTAQLGSELVTEARRQLDEADFWSQPPYQLDATMDDGSTYVVTAGRGDQSHEVIYEALETPLTAFLETIIREHQP